MNYYKCQYKHACEVWWLSRGAISSSFPRNVKDQVWSGPVPTTCQRHLSFFTWVLFTLSIYYWGHTCSFSESETFPSLFPSDNSEPFPTDFRLLADEDSLPASTLASRAAVAFRFLGMVEEWGLLNDYQHDIKVPFLILETTYSNRELF